MNIPIQNHCLELYQILVELFKGQDKLPQGTTMLQVCGMNDDQRRAFVVSLSNRQQHELGNTSMTVKKIRKYAVRTMEKIALLQTSFNPHKKSTNLAA